LSAARSNSGTICPALQGVEPGCLLSRVQVNGLGHGLAEDRQ